MQVNIALTNQVSNCQLSRRGLFNTGRRR